MTTTMTLNRRRMPGSLLAAATIAATLACALSAAAGNLTGPDVTVRFGDLDVDTGQGASTLLNRIEHAAEQVCAPLDHGDLASRANRQDCYRKLIAAAVAKANRPALAAAYESARRKSPALTALVR